MNSIEVVIKEQGIEANNAKVLIEAFGAPFTEAGDILLNYQSIVVDSVNQKDVMADAKSKRLILKRIRTTVENKRKALKEDSLKTGKAIDSVARYIKETIVPAEEYLETQEKYAEIQQANLLLELSVERMRRLEPFVQDTSIYAFSSYTFDEFEKLLKDSKEAFELRKAQELAYENEQKKLAEEKAAEDLRIREENEKLRKEAAARDAELKAERDKVEAIERKHQNELQAQADAKKEQEASDAKLASAPKREQLMSFVLSLELLNAPTDTQTAERINKHMSESVAMYRKLIEEEL